MSKDSSRSLKEEHFGPLCKYVKDDNITNIDWNNGQLWIQRANRDTEEVIDTEVNEDFMFDFRLNVGNYSNPGKNFNKTDNVIMSDTDDLRIVCVHPSFSLSGVSVCIRKSLRKLRFSAKTALEQSYCEEETMNMLINCVLAGKNFVYCGEPSKGKTEAAKFFSSYIQPNKKVVTVEDVREWHYKEINEGKSCIELKVNSHDDFEDALALAVRLNPSWLMISEVRGRESRYLLEAWSNGISNMSTIHTKGVEFIEDRLLNMLGSGIDVPSVRDQIYSNVGVGVHLDVISLGNGETRHIINEVGFYYRHNGVNGLSKVVENGKLYKDRLPDFIRKDVERKIGSDIFVCDIKYSNKAKTMG